MEILPKTRKTIKKEIIPKIASILPSFMKNNSEVADRLDDIESVQELILKKMEEERQYSGAFDYYHQATPNSISPNVLEQLYGRDLNFLRQYYQICSPIDQLIFQKKFQQFRAVSTCVADNPNKVGWRVVHKRHGSSDYQENDIDKMKCRFLEALIQNPNKQRHPGGFVDAGIAILESMMLFDRVPIEKVKHRDRKSYPGLPASYLIPDAATIKPTTWVLHAMAGSSGYTGRNEFEQAKTIAVDSSQTARNLLTYDTQAQIIAKQLVAKGKGDSIYREVDRLTSGVIKWVQQMPDKQVAAGYTDDDLSVFIGNPSPQINTWGWSSGSAFERSFAFGEVIFKMTGYNYEIFDSRMPEAILAISNNGVDKRRKQQLHERMNEEGSDRYSNLLVEFVADPEKDIKYTKLKDKPKDMQYHDMFILYVKLKCSAYGIDYTELNIEDGKSAGLGGSRAHEKRMDDQKSTGIHADTGYIAHCITESLIAPWSPDFMMEFIHDVSETKEEVDLRKEKMDYKSLHETRREDNLEKEWWLEAPKEFQEELKGYSKIDYIPGITAQGRIQILTLLMNQAQEEKMQAQEQEMAQQEGEQAGNEMQENPEITNLKSAIGQGESQQDMGKSFAITVKHEY